MHHEGCIRVSAVVSMWLAGLLHFLLSSQALAKTSKADVYVFDTGYEEIFLPAIDIKENGTVLPAAVHRVYKFRDCKFRLSFNAILCPEMGHKVIVSFMNHWPDPTKITKKMMERNSIIYQGDDRSVTLLITWIGANVLLSDRKAQW
ncbi:hypothetical protein GCK32_018193 [Trichostrongylus colubriformis]|uniref:Uncharacterized protein n=1 Tax=Trichostrongylus colubriformis TaxID=6319 RepID=A0AAN8GBJ3_TRICO